MSKYLHQYNSGKCRHCGMTACFRDDEEKDELVKVGELQICASCRSVEYCCKEHQRLDWPNHKKFCKRFRKLISEYKLARDSRLPGCPKPSKPTPYPLHDFIERGDWQGLLLFLENHPSYNVNQMEGGAPDFMSPLLLACGQGQIECVHILLSRGADFESEDKSSNLTPLIYASWWGHADIVQLLLNRGADVNQKTSHDTFALGYACSKLQPEVVKLLFLHGADVNERNFMGWTTLMNTVCLASTPGPEAEARTEEQAAAEDVPLIISIVKLLLQAGADINARGYSGWGSQEPGGDTALNLCCSDDKIEIVKLLIDNGANLDIQRAGDDRNALLAASEHKSLRVVELLIRRGCDTTVRDSEGRTYKDLLKLPWEGKGISDADFQRIVNLDLELNGSTF